MSTADTTSSARPGRDANSSKHRPVGGNAGWSEANRVVSRTDRSIRHQRKREVLMRSQCVAEEALPDVGVDERRREELVKRIRKLRWLGLEQEASELQAEVSCAWRLETVITAPQETD